MHIDQMANENPTLETNFAATPAMAHKIIFMDDTEAVINNKNSIIYAWQQKNCIFKKSHQKF